MELTPEPEDAKRARAMLPHLLWGLGFCLAFLLWVKGSGPCITEPNTTPSHTPSPKRKTKEAPIEPIWSLCGCEGEGWG